MYEDNANQCTTKLNVAIGYLGNMSSSARTTFATSEDYVISTARERLEAWAKNQGKTVDYSTGTLSNSRNTVSLFDSKESSNTILIMVIALASSSSIVLCLLIRKKRLMK